ncbi:unnamed protein product [Phytomonas sp. Hart1]|nr:unnamed protein product [Phytomonas sp. Hart1]|eukprot:CCW72079.1 unnamed protein product [Phytomonas sp. isolate Hart1]
MWRIYSRVPYVTQTPITNHLLFSTTSKLYLEAGLSEQDRERELRKLVLRKYNGTSIPEINSFEYGHFSSGDINVSTAQYAFHDSDASFNGDILSNNGWRRIINMIWPIIFVGFALIYFLSNVFLRTSYVLNGLDLPLWLASIERHSKYIIFEIQFDEQTKNNLKKEFEFVHLSNPFVDFFVWVKTRKPEFEFGIRYGPEVCINTLLSFLANTEPHMLTIFYRSIQMASLKKNKSPTQRLDEFIDQIRFSGAVLNGCMNPRAFSSENVDCSKPAPIPFVQLPITASEVRNVNYY